MANPQTENGYTRIANESLENLALTRIPGQARQVLDFIIRKTYGWGKKTDKISLSQFVKGTGLSKVAVSKGIKKLTEMNLITKKGNALSLFTQKGNDTAVTYGFNKNYAEWLPLPKKVTLPKKVKHVTQKGKETLPKKVTPPLKETITKETITKERKKLLQEKNILPNWLPNELWQSFIEHRKSFKPKMTHHAEKLNLNKLISFHEQGYDCEEIVNKTIANGWKGFFKPKNKPKYKSNLLTEAGLATAELLNTITFEGEK